MGFVVSFTDYIPGARFDGESWITAIIDEATSPSGPWTTIDTIALTPDANPAQPQTRNLTTSHATIQSGGWYRVTFVDAVGGTEYTSPVMNEDVSGASIATLADVKRVAGITTSTNDVALTAALQAVESYLESRLLPYGRSGGTEVYVHALPGASFRLPVPDATVAAVRGYAYPGSPPRVLSPINDYQVANGSVVLTQWGPYYYDGYTRGDIPPAAGVGLAFAPATWDRIEIDWTSASGVPAALRDGVAIAAASLASQQGRVSGGVRQETIGDYSYRLDDKDFASLIPSKAQTLLAPFLRRRSVLVS